MKASIAKRTAIAALALCALHRPSDAEIVSFQGRAPISYGSSIPGIVRHDVFSFDLSIDDSVLDSDNRSFVNGFGGITSLGHFSQAITNFRLSASPSNVGSYDPSGVTYDYSRSYFTTIDAGPGVSNFNYTEKLKAIIEVSNASLAAGAPFQFVVLNLYNGTLYDPPATRQIWIDESDSGNPTSFADFFLHGTRTLGEFRGSVPANADTAHDGIFLEGLPGSGQLASGEGVTLSAVPEIDPAAIGSVLALVGGALCLVERRRARAS